MNEEKFLRLQTEIKNNNDEMMKYINDLNSWEEEIKTKEESKQDEKQTKKIPPIRSKKTKKKKTKETCQTKKIKSCDYKAWDKFDADKACEENDQWESEDELEYDYDLIEKLREQGNEFLKSGKYSEAVEKYSQALIWNPHQSILYSNRAIAYIKMEMWQAAENDCTKAIECDPNNVKAYLRRGKARMSLENYIQSQEDFNKVLKFEPSNKDSKENLRDIKQILSSKEKLEQITEICKSEIVERVIVKPISKPSSERSKKPLRRITIEETGMDEVVLPVKSDMKSGEDTRFQHFLEEITHKDTVNECVEKDKEVENCIKKESDVEDKAARDDEKVKENIINKEDDFIRNITENVDKEVKNCVIEKSEALESAPFKEGNNLVTDARTDLHNSNYNKGHDISSLPTNSYQFYKEWRALRNKDVEFFHYFKMIEPASYRHIFGEAFDSDILSKIISTIHKYSDDIDAYKVLHRLANVKRFSMNAVFMTGVDRQKLTDIFEKLSLTNKLEDVTHLKSLYK